VLDKHNLPLELKYLAVVESALNPVALSRVGACGLWQFMLPTGKIYGLEINSLLDERRDPEKATEAACKYFEDTPSMATGTWCWLPITVVRAM
jgi:membrane-bound lytic murein transglycosylase D